MKRATRVSAYAVCRADNALLLVHQVAVGPAQGMWTLPGGGIDFGEHPADAVIREVWEETGLTARVEGVLAVHDNIYDVGDGVQRHGVRLLFAASVEGEITLHQPDEIDQVAWHQIDSLPTDITGWAALSGGLPI